VTTKERMLLLAILYPLALGACGAGFIAFVLLLLKFPLLFVSTAVVWFYCICAATVYVISKPVLELLGVGRKFLLLVAAMGAFAAVSTGLVLGGPLAH